jgi:hypothetical protein
MYCSRTKSEAAQSLCDTCEVESMPPAKASVHDCDIRPCQMAAENTVEFAQIDGQNSVHVKICICALREG